MTAPGDIDGGGRVAGELINLNRRDQAEEGAFLPSVVCGASSMLSRWRSIGQETPDACAISPMLNMSSIADPSTMGRSSPVLTRDGREGQTTHHVGSAELSTAIWPGQLPTGLEPLSSRDATVHMTYPLTLIAQGLRDGQESQALVDARSSELAATRPGRGKLARRLTHCSPTQTRLATRSARHCAEARSMGGHGSNLPAHT